MVPIMADAPAVARALDGVLDRASAPPAAGRAAAAGRRGQGVDGTVRQRACPSGGSRPDDSLAGPQDRAVQTWTRRRWTGPRVGSTAGGEQEFVVVLAHRAVVEDYERVCARRPGAHAGLVDLLSFSLIDAALARGVGRRRRRLAARARRGPVPAPWRSCGVGTPCCSGPSPRTGSRWATWCIRRRCTTRIGIGGGSLSRTR